MKLAHTTRINPHNKYDISGCIYDQHGRVVAYLPGYQGEPTGAVQDMLPIILAIPELLNILDEAQQAIDTLADDSEEAGYPARAAHASSLAMRIREAVNKATSK